MPTVAVIEAAYDSLFTLYTSSSGAVEWQDENGRRVRYEDSAAMEKKLRYLSSLLLTGSNAGMATNLAQFGREP